MKLVSRLLNPLFIAAIASSCTTIHTSPDRDSAAVKNVILMIGDGMGLPDVYAAMTVADSSLNLERCTAVGLIKTYSSDAYITDSGAAGTALATGNKTRNGTIGMDSLGQRLQSILEIAVKHGLATGLVSTSAITHATPASFIAHQQDRGSYEDIAADFLKTGIDVFIGGGIDHFARRADKINLLDTLKARGYEVDTTLALILESTASKLAGLTAPVHNPYRLRGRGNMLPASTGKALEILQRNKEGFFLMVEGSEIDWAAHENSADFLIDETLDFDKAAGVALDFAARDGHTLVIITADHETGGVTITGGDMAAHRVVLSFSTNDHTAVMVPVYAYGPGSGKFAGIYDNTGIFSKIMNSLGF